MKVLLLLSIAAISGFPASFSAENEASAAATLERNADYERYRALSAKIINILENQELIFRKQEEINRRLDSLTRDVETLKERSGRNSENAVTREELKVYVEKLKEIDGKREADKALLLKSLRDLAKLPVAPPPSRSSNRESPNAGPTYDYTVQSGDSLLEIVKSYNSEFEKQGLRSIDIDKVEEANPGLKPDRIFVGQVLKIPIPEKK